MNPIIKYLFGLIALLCIALGCNQEKEIHYIRPFIAKETDSFILIPQDTLLIVFKGHFSDEPNIPTLDTAVFLLLDFRVPVLENYTVEIVKDNVNKINVCAYIMMKKGF